MAIKALLIDLPRCIGCRGCQVACKHQYKRTAERTQFFGGPGYQNPADLSPETWCLVTYNEVVVNGRYEWVFGKRQCMHCQVPGCASACPVKALEKLDSGPVTYHRDKCIGCRYCMLACPFVVPRFEYEKWSPYITKCTMCADRQAAGEIPACAKACPTGAITFGDREALIQEAQHRIASNPSKYVHHIYGLNEAGGTCVLHISSVPFEKLGYVLRVPRSPMVAHTEPAMKAIPMVMLGLASLLGVSYALRTRNQRNQGHVEAPGASERSGR
jgi:formate dehydrogenase iron-sulfur subunit